MSTSRPLLLVPLLLPENLVPGRELAADQQGSFTLRRIVQLSQSFDNDANDVFDLSCAKHESVNVL